MITVQLSPCPSSDGEKIKDQNQKQKHNGLWYTEDDQACNREQTQLYVPISTPD